MRKLIKKTEQSFETVQAFASGCVATCRCVCYCNTAAFYSEYMSNDAALLKREQLKR